MAAPATRRIQAVLWDLDGTLVDSEHLHVALDRAVLAELGVEVDAATYAARFTGMTSRNAFATLLAEAGADPALADDALARKRARAPEAIIARTLSLRGAGRALADIPMRTHRFALVTSAERYLAEALLERFGWTWRFEVVVTADDVTAPKPAPEPYLRACDALGLPPAATLAVEDSVNGIRSARAAGCLVAALPGTFPQEALHEAHYVLSDVGAVAGLLGVLG